MKLGRAAVAAGLAVAAVAAHAQFVAVNEGFENVATLPASGWVINNASTPLGPTSWFQGAAAIFPAFAGSPDSYIAANFNSALAGGTIANFLFTPIFTTEGGSTVSFWARSIGEPRVLHDRAGGVDGGVPDRLRREDGDDQSRQRQQERKPCLHLGFSSLAR